MVRGYYKVVILISGKVVGVSKSFLVKQHYVQIPFPKRTFSYCKLLPIMDNIANTYFQYKNEVESFYSGVYIAPKTLNSTRQDPSYELYPKLDGYQVGDLINFPPGLYHIRYFSA
jgi:hypothetical protein